MFEACDFFNECGKCDHPGNDTTCATDVWSNNCLQAFNSEEIICQHYFSRYQPDVKFNT